MFSSEATFLIIVPLDAKGEPAVKMLSSIWCIYVAASTCVYLAIIQYYTYVYMLLMSYCACWVCIEHQSLLSRLPHQKCNAIIGKITM